MDDRLLKFLFRDAPVRGEIVRLQQSWQQIVASEIRFKTYHLEDARYAVIGFPARFQP